MDLFGKSTKGYLEHKTKFYESNSEMLRDDDHFRTLYGSQIARENCIICGHALEDGSLKLNVRGINYLSCWKCAHLNGEFKETDQFCNELYARSSENDYGSAYFVESQQSFEQRRDDIYAPKALFLEKSIQELLNHEQTPILDYGCGSGYFVSAMRELGYLKVHGIDVSQSQVLHGNERIGSESALSHVDEPDFLTYISTMRPRVVSMLGVLEHLQDPVKRLQEIVSIPTVDYLYISVPTFSMSVFLESVFPNVYPRQTSAGHTHLFTVESLDYCLSLANVTATQSWWFGTDILDLVRSIAVESPVKVREEWLRRMMPLVDELQLVLDENKWCSEVHHVLRVIR